MDRNYSVHNTMRCNGRNLRCSYVRIEVRNKLDSAEQFSLNWLLDVSGSRPLLAIMDNRACFTFPSPFSRKLYLYR